MLCRVYISLGASAPFISLLGCIPISTSFFSNFLGCVIASSAFPFPNFETLRCDILYKRNAIKAKRASSIIPKETPTPIPIFADWLSDAADAEEEDEVGIEADVEEGVEADVEIAV